MRDRSNSSTPELRVCRRRCKGRTFLEHRTQLDQVCDKRCAPHQRRPLSVSSVRECHAVLSGALSAALRWGWIAVNPLEAVKRPATLRCRGGGATTLRVYAAWLAATDKTAAGLLAARLPKPPQFQV